MAAQPTRERRTEVSSAKPEREARADSRRLGRHRLLPCQVFLSTGVGSRLLFPASPFDEFRCAQRRVEGKHRLEFLTRLEPRDVGREAFRPFACFDLRQEGASLVDLANAKGLWRRLRARGVDKLPRPRLRGEPYREDCISLAPGQGSGRYQRPSEGSPSRARLLDVLRSQCTPSQWIAWFEAAFPAPAEGMVLHRYYLDGDLGAYLVRDHCQEGKRLHRARAAGSAPGLWIYPERRAAA